MKTKRTNRTKESYLPSEQDVHLEEHVARMQKVKGSDGRVTNERMCLYFRDKRNKRGGRSTLQSESIEERMLFKTINCFGSNCFHEDLKGRTQ